MSRKYIFFALVVIIVAVCLVVYLNKEQTVGCHFKAHMTAFNEIKQNPDQWEDVLSKYSVSECTGGYLMGVLEGRKAFDPSFKLDSKTSVATCKSLEKNSSAKKTEMTCMHTMGHLFLTEKKGDLDQALKICSQVPGKHISECYAGVFMESIYKLNLHAHNLAEIGAWNSDDVKKQIIICNSYLGKRTQACWREISHMLVHLTNRDSEEIHRLCGQAKNLEARDECYIHSVAILTLTSTNQQDLCQKYADKRNLLLRCESVIKNNSLD